MSARFVAQRSGHTGRRLRRWFGVLGLFGALIASTLYFAGSIYEFEESVTLERMPEVDAIVTLAGARGRIRAAGDLWYRYYLLAKKEKDIQVPILYLSGMGPKANWDVVQSRLSEEVLEVIEPSDVVLETESVNTIENAEWLARIADDREWDSILLFTSSYHLKRAKFVFQRILGRAAEIQGEDPVSVETKAVWQEPFVPGHWRSDLDAVQITLSEFFKLTVHRTFL